ncbi:MAG TPA: hypothetical protein VFF06_15325 [Polyangia bacterium]|nr:hypothetical protein [Polyangia bacterium]
MSDVYALVRSIRANRFSRNRHFDEHATPEAAAARRLNRFLRGVERDVMAASHVQARREGERYVVWMQFVSVRLSRRVALTAEEHALLVEDSRLAPLLTPIA